MNGTTLRRIVVLLSALTVVSAPAFAQVELGGSYSIRMYEDYIERGPGSFMGDFTGMPMNDEARLFESRNYEPDTGEGDVD